MTLESLLDQQNVIEVVNRIGRSADRREWEECRRCFVGEIYLDHDASHHGAANRAASEVIAEWAELFQNFSATLHFVSSFEFAVTGDTATCRSLVQAIHKAADPARKEFSFQIFGTYQDELSRASDGWKVTARTYREIARMPL